MIGWRQLQGLASIGNAPVQVAEQASSLEACKRGIGKVIKRNTSVRVWKRFNSNASQWYVMNSSRYFSPPVSSKRVKWATPRLSNDIDRLGWDGGNKFAAS